MIRPWAKRPIQMKANQMDDLSRIKERKAALKSELADLETAERVLEQLRSPRNGTKSVARITAAKVPAGHSLKTIAEYAKEILPKAGAEGMHFREVAHEALRMGYTGRKSSTEKAIAQSFWATMHRDKQTFVAIGDGRYSLK